MAVTVTSIEFPRNLLIKEGLASRVTSAKTIKSTVQPTQRPKSTPIKLRSDGIEAFLLDARCQTAQACHRTDVIASRRSERANTPHKKTDLPDKGAEAIKCEVYNLGPGYVIFREGSQFNIRIDSDEFYGPHNKDRRSRLMKQKKMDQKDLEIEQLKEQIINLTVFLEEEKMNHNLSVEKWQDQLTETVEKLQSTHDRYVSQMVEKHDKLVQLTNERHQNDLLHQEKQLNDKLDAVVSELNTYKASFESYRQVLQKETLAQFEIQKLELARAHQEHLQKSLDKQKEQLTVNHNMDLERIKEENQQTIADIKRRNDQEIDMLTKRFADAAGLEERLSQTIQDLARMRREYAKLQDDFDDNRELLTKTRKELSVQMNENESLKSELEDFSVRFEERVRRVDDDYKERMDSLQNQIVEMRRAYVAKCEELVAERKQVDTKLHGRIESAKDVMKEIISTRQRARISLVSMTEDMEFETPALTHKRLSNDIRLPNHTRSTYKHSPSYTPASATVNQDSTSRPSSAPITNKDELQVKHKSLIFNRERY